MTTEEQKKEENFKVKSIRSALEDTRMIAFYLNQAHNAYLKVSKYRYKFYIRTKYYPIIKKNFKLFKENPNYIEENEFGSEAVRWANVFCYLNDVKKGSLSDEERKQFFNLVIKVMPKTSKKDHISKKYELSRKQNRSINVPQRLVGGHNNAKEAPCCSTQSWKGGCDDIPQMLK